MTIVQAAPADLETLAGLFDAYRVFYERVSDPDAARNYLHDRLTRDEATVFLALQENEALGFALCYCTFSSVALKPLVILNDLYTTPEARGRGVATALIARCADFARSHGAEILRLRTARDNRSAQAVYERVGFVRDEVFFTYDLKL
ncbi:MAG: GNAT family N-acetyltransferase [Pleurocapsa sp. SU_196_0]|nr:GNAT family N-acetyltransferase [Pleurocapsa sp. SU_196_0]